MELSVTDRLQPPFPSTYNVPTLVQPDTTISSLVKNALLYQKVSELEELLCNFYGVKYCILVDRARTGAYLLAKGLGLDDGWILTSFMHRPFTALLANTVDKISFADINSDFTINTGSAVSLIDSTTQVLLATHMYGKSADIVELRNVADNNNLFLIENCVHMSGKFNVRGKSLGGWGDAALLSFNVDKPLSGLLGGAILTNRKDVWESICSIKLSGNNVTTVLKKISSTYFGYYFKPQILKTGILKKKAIDGVDEVEKFSVDEYKRFTPRDMHYLQKVALLNNLNEIDKWSLIRKENATQLSSYLVSNSSLIIPEDTKDQPNSYLYYPIIFKDHCRYKVSCAMAKMGIETKWRYFPLHMQKEFDNFKWNSLDNSSYYWKQHLLIPIGHKLSSMQVKYVAESILNALNDENLLQA